jgi:hypothetical protein
MGFHFLLVDLIDLLVTFLLGTAFINVCFGWKWNRLPVI